MRCTPIVLALLVSTAPLIAQDLQLRQEAIRLLERANAVSMAPNLPNLERTVAWRVLDSASGPQEGTFTRVVVQGTGGRDEFIFGDYHVINVYTGSGLATTRTREVPPPEVHDVMRITPIALVRFDHEDVIHTITDSSLDGRPLRCIQFSTIAGEKDDSNELCVDTANGTLVTEKLGKDYMENRDFFPFADSLIPGRITYSYAGIPKLEISQTMSVLTEVTPNVLAAPPNAQMRRYCTTFRRAFGVTMPQPEPGPGGGDTDVVLRGIIGEDGKVHEAVVQATDRPDLNPEALRVIQQWVFTPAMCDGRPGSTDASFTLHFQAR
jgi:hypothetical protein